MGNQNQKYFMFIIIVVSFITSSLFLIKSQYDNNKKNLMKNRKEKNPLSDKIIDIRRLEKENDKESDKIHIKSLINIINYIFDKDKGVEKNISNIKKEYINYFKHISPPLIFLAIGLFTIPAWFIFCICYRCNCCYCGCFKNYPDTIGIINIIFYLLTISLSIYGIVKSINIFVGMIDIECSIHKFFEQTIEGEAKQNFPKYSPFTDT